MIARSLTSNAFLCAVVLAAWSSIAGAQPNNAKTHSAWDDRAEMVARSGSRIACEIWFNDNGWMLRTTGRKDKPAVRIKGRVQAVGGRFRSMTPVSVDTGAVKDKLTMNTDRDTISFNFVSGGGTDGFDFEIGPNVTSLSFSVEVDGVFVAESVLIGRSTRPTRNPFEVKIGNADPSNKVGKTVTDPNPVVKKSTVVPDLPPAAEGTGSTLTRKEADGLVARHDRARRDVGVGPLKWSNKLATFAQQWADEIARTGKFEHRTGHTYGENLAAGSGNSYGVLTGVEDWYSEIKLYKAGTPIDGNFEAYGHYTQMVWSKTTEVGAGKAVIKTGPMKGWLVIVANYDPPGNYRGVKPY